MRSRAIRDLSRLPDHDLFQSVAEGLTIIIESAERLHEASERLAVEGQFRGYQVLRAVAEEEVSKFLILIDAIRCPRTPAKRWSEQLGRFHDHMSKGLYGWAYNCRPATLQQLQEYLDLKRQEFYLDGPNDVDWIFRNDILQRREEALYVDYVETDEGHVWLDPARYHWDDRLVPTGLVLPSLLVSQALASAGASSPDGLAVLADVWRAMPMSLDLRWMEVREVNRKTLVELEKKGVLREYPQEIYDKIIDRWQFPMYDLDLTLVRVKKETLRERQRNWASY